MNGEKTIVIGLDGGHFELIEPWIEAGELPNIGKLIGDGVTADSQSVLPPVTSPNWKAYATGKNPGKLGIFWWENIDMKEERVYYPDSRKSKHTEFWEIIGTEASAGVINVPTTYPPKEVEPFIVAGAPDSDSSGYTYPPELEAELEEQLDYRVTKDTPIKSNPEKAASEIIELIDLRFRTGKYLLNEYDPEFLQITTFYLNSLHHFFWDDQKTLKGWKVIDRHLGDFLREKYNVVLMSDHGATEIQTVFHINAWLEQEGYLTSDMAVSDALSDVGITAENLIVLTDRLGIRDIAKKATPKWVIDRIPSEEGEVQRERKTANLNWDKTTVLASGQGPIYIDSRGSEREQIQTELIEKLSNLTGPNGQGIAENIYRGEDVYNGPYSEEAPDLVIDQMDGVHIQGGLGRDEIFTKPKDDGWRGENKRDALFVGAGPDFTTGKVEKFSILDIAPTLLHLHGCKIPKDVDGQVRKEVYKEDSNVTEEEVLYSELASQSKEKSNADQKDEEVQNRLKDLGYLE